MQVRSVLGVASPYYDRPFLQRIRDKHPEVFGDFDVADGLE